MRFPATSTHFKAPDSGKAKGRFSIVMWTVGIGTALSVATGSASCSGDSSPVAPTAAAVPSGPTPTVTALSINMGSTGGGTPVRITGTDLQRGASVTFGSTTVTSTGYDPRDEPGTSILIDTPAHAAGLVDVVVTNLNRQTFRLSQGYEYVPQDSFDFNGDWDGVTTDGSDTLVQFTIRNNMLVTASCRSDLDNKIVALFTAVTNGEFSAQAQDGFVLSGRIVSASQAVGQMTAAPCIGNTHPWRASKLGSLLKTAVFTA